MARPTRVHAPRALAAAFGACVLLSATAGAFADRAAAAAANRFLGMLDEAQARAAVLPPLSTPALPVERLKPNEAGHPGC